ncbi:MAG: hypothetical protein QM736_20580 [Vicinamibacterales bacterium]
MRARLVRKIKSCPVFDLELNEIESIGAIMAHDPDQFLAMLQQAFPEQYARLGTLAPPNAANTSRPPINRAHQTAQVREAALSTIRKQVQDARQHWDGFADHEDAILTELRNDTAQKLTLHDAYRIVTARAHKAERDQLRQEVAKAKDTTRTAAPRSTRAIIAEAARGLRR